jgi:hypothetical protein
MKHIRNPDCRFLILTVRIVGTTKIVSRQVVEIHFDEVPNKKKVKNVYPF